MVFINVDRWMIGVWSWLVVEFSEIFIVCFWNLWDCCLIIFGCGVLRVVIKIIGCFWYFFYFVIFILKFYICLLSIILNLV